jgi:hypothetical protein
LHSQNDLQQFPSCGLIRLEGGADDSIQVQLQCEMMRKPEERPLKIVSKNRIPEMKTREDITKK